jgi:putative SOS response-associated peptidase YedK
MCNLYSITSSQAAIRQLARASRDLTGNLPPLPAVFPDQMAPVVRTGGDGQRELVMMRWGLGTSWHLYACNSARYRLNCSIGASAATQ